MNAQVIVCCGSGGVGKTTTSAALAVRWATEGDRVCVLTIDPAKRLADSLGLTHIGGRPTVIPMPNAPGQCDAVMLDVQETFEGLIRTFSASEASASRILENRYFQFASTRLGGVHEYMAAEKVRELATNGHYDTIIVDTPPTRNALDFLEAPERMAELMNGSVMRWLSSTSKTGGWKAFELGGEAITRVLQTLVGDNTIGDIAQFFDLFRELWDGFQSRSLEVQAMLRDETTRFLLVSSPSSAARTEALFFLDQLRDKAMPFGGFLVNRVEGPVPFEKSLLPTNGPGDWATVAAQIEQMHATQSDLVAIHERSIDSLASAGPPNTPIWRIPHQGTPVNSIASLTALAEFLPSRNEI